VAGHVGVIEQREGTVEGVEDVSRGFVFVMILGGCVGHNHFGLA
jgi:hypothetical protein